MKLCKDCRHSSIQPMGRQKGLKMCMHPALAIKGTNYYDGTTSVSHPTCQQARLIGNCEVEGNLWEPHEVGFGVRDEE